MTICVKFCNIGGYNLAIEQISVDGNPCYAFATVPPEGSVQVFSGANDPAGDPTPKDIYWFYENTTEGTLWFWSPHNEIWSLLNEDEVNFIQQAGAPSGAPTFPNVLTFSEDTTSRAGFDASNLYHWSQASSRWLELQAKVRDDIFTVNPNGRANYPSMNDAFADESLPAGSTLIVSGDYPSITETIVVGDNMTVLFDGCSIVRRSGPAGPLFSVSHGAVLNLYTTYLTPVMQRLGVDPLVQIEHTDGSPGQTGLVAHRMHLQSTSGTAVYVNNTAPSNSITCDIRNSRIQGGQKGISCFGLINAQLRENYVVASVASVENRGVAVTDDWNGAEFYFNTFSSAFGGSAAINTIGFNHFQ